MKSRDGDDNKMGGEREVLLNKKQVILISCITDKSTNCTFLPCPGIVESSWDHEKERRVFLWTENNPHST